MKLFGSNKSKSGRRKRKSPPLKISSPSDYVAHSKQHYLTTENERKFYAAMQEVVPDEYVIHSQVSLMALVKPVNFRDNSKTWAKRMDFVITDKMTRVLVVIELDDSTHNWKKRIARDKYVNSALDGHHKLLRFQTQRHYKPSEIASILESETEIRCLEDTNNHAVA
nr:DUF2726 domain-containing protein [Vibrio sinus]